MFTIKDLYFGGMYPLENVPTSERYLRASKEFEDCEDQLVSTLSSEQKAVFNQLCELEALKTLEETATAFELGFCMATQLLCNALVKDSNTD